MLVSWQVVDPPSLWLCVFHPPSSCLYGVAYFSLASESLSVGEFGDFACVQELKAKLGPSQIVTNASPNDQLHAELACNEVTPSEPYEMVTLKRQEFTTESAIQRLKLVKVEDLAYPAGGGPDGEAADLKSQSKIDHALLLKSVLDFQRPTLLSAIGGLICHLLHSAIFAQLESDRLYSPVLIHSIRPIPDTDLVRVDLLTRESLSIFVSEAHPSAGGGPRPGGARAKEGFSVFSLMNQTRTPGGARMLREWMENPVKELELIQERLDHVEYFTLEENTVSADTG